MEEKGLTAEQIYNADETGLLWKCLPDRTLVSCREKSAPGFKKSKDCLTVLGCTNATGTHKLKPVMIGKFAKPRCFKNVNMDALPVIYKSQRNAWMNSEIFAEWFKKDFVPAAKRHQRAQNICSPKALLLIDNCSAHPQELKTRDGSVTCMLLPPNTSHSHSDFSWTTLSKGERCMRLSLCEAPTSETRPDHNTGNYVPYNSTSLIQDQGVLQAMKNRYKRKLLRT